MVSVASLATLLRLWPFKSRKKGEKHRQAFVMAGVEFQKYQCYYAGAIQIAAHVVSQQRPANRCSTGT
jgi:hypothetical protein